MQKRKVLLVYNETNPELYHTKTEIEQEHLDFLPYFEIENVTPMEEFDLMANFIREAGFDVKILNLNDSFQLLLDNLNNDRPDVIFNCIEIFYGRAPLEMNVAGLFELMEIPYTGAPALTLANCQNKALTKMILREYGIRTPKFEMVRAPFEQISLTEFPLIVKPVAEDASVGIENASVVRTPEALKKRIDYIHHEFYQPAIVEQFIPGRELNVAVLGGAQPRVLPISEIDFSEMPDHLEKIVSYQAKWDSLHEAYHTTIPICPAELPDAVRIAIEETALKVYNIMELRDYCRVDMRLSADNLAYVLEANPNPDLSEGAGFMRSAEAAGYSYQDMLVRIIEMALTRKK